MLGWLGCCWCFFFLSFRSLLIFYFTLWLFNFDCAQKLTISSRNYWTDNCLKAASLNVSIVNPDCSFCHRAESRTPAKYWFIFGRTWARHSIHPNAYQSQCAEGLFVMICMRISKNRTTDRPANEKDRDEVESEHKIKSIRHTANNSQATNTLRLYRHNVFCCSLALCPIDRTTAYEVRQKNEIPEILLRPKICEKKRKGVCMHRRMYQTHSSSEQQ